MSYTRLLLATAIGTIASAGLAQTRTGAAAFGDAASDAPGLMRKITPADLPPGDAEAATTGRSQVVAPPHGARPATMPGFTAMPFVTGMKGARGLRAAPNGDVFLTLSRPEGKVMVLQGGANGQAPRVTTFAEGLKDPYGIAFFPPGPDPKWVYVGMSGEVVRFPYASGATTASGKAEAIVSGLPTGGHWTRDIAFSPDGKTLYVAVGSSGNVAADMGAKPNHASFETTHALGSAWGKEDGRANVLAFDPDGKNRRIYATGIRNCAGLAVQPGTGTLFCATNERDMIGDNVPPDYVTSVKEGGFYGWPWFYIGNTVDTRAGGGPRPDLKDKVIVPDVLLQAHSAALNLAFDSGGQFPPEWTGDAFVALHGSWNRAQRTGYKIVRLPFKDGKATGEYQDFVTGMTSGADNVWARPVGVTFMKDGSLLFSDDGNGIVYRVTYAGPKL